MARFPIPRLLNLSVFLSEQKHVSTSDENGTYEYIIKDSIKNFRVISKEGETLFDGPVTHQTDRDKLPIEFKKKLFELENM